MNTLIDYTRIAILLLASITVLSCSKKSGPDQQPGGKLALTVSENPATTESPVTFAVTADGVAVSGAQIIINDSPITGDSHQFTQPGTYTIIARKANYPDSDPVSLSVKRVQTNVYTAGVDLSGINSKAQYWNNLTFFSLGGTSTSSGAYGISVYEDDAYVAGWARHGVDIATYWKNGQAMQLTNGPHFALIRDIHVDATGIHLVGANGSDAMYWHNTTGYKLPAEGSTYAGAIGIYVAGNDVYIAGAERSGSLTYAKYWKNQVPVNLTNGVNESSATGIYAIGNDIYVCGVESNRATYWKNSAATSLSDVASLTLDMCGRGNDIYICGAETPSGKKSVATYWKNGVATALTDGSNEALAKSIYVLGNDIYVAGYEYTGDKKTPKYWKNGTEVVIGQNAELNAIFVTRTLID